MIHSIKYAIIADIGTYDLTYYDEDRQEELADYCRRHLFSYLPGKDKKSLYKVTDRGFRQEDLKEKVSFKPYERIFSHDILNRFKKLEQDDVGLIMENGLIKGMIHIVNYNCKFIKLEIYRALYEFDENLRKLLLDNLIKNDDFIDWVGRQKEKEDREDGYWTERYKSLQPENEELRQKKINSRQRANAFETFYLSDLLEYNIDLGLLEADKVYEKKIKNIRNSVAHAMNASSMTGIENDEIHTFEVLEGFVNRSRHFFEAFEYLEGKVMTPDD